MGDDDDVPAAPDYSPLFKLAEESSKYSFQLGKEQLDFFKKIYDKNQKTSDIVIEKALGEMDKQIADSDRYRKQQIEIYDPLKEQYAQAAQDYNTPERQEVEAGKAEADVAAQFEQARQAAVDNLEQFGVDPSQTRSSAMDLATRVAEGAAQASAGNQARWRTEQTGLDLMGNAINQGAGLPSQIAGASGAGGQSGNQAVNTGLATTASAAQTLGTGPQWQQIGNQGLGNWGNLMNQSYQNQMAGYEAKQNSSSGIGEILGAGLGMATMFIAEGGAIPDPEEGGMIPIEASPSGGAIEDDIPAEIEGGQPAQLNAGEFVIPKDVVAWLGEKGMQQIILKARKEMGDPNAAPAQPTQGPPPGGPPPQFESVGAIPA